jgi:hypothetical protein
MSATEIIAEIKKLPAADQEDVFVFLSRQLKEGAARGSGAGVRYARDEDVDKAVDDVLRDRADLFRRLAQ